MWKDTQYLLEIHRKYHVTRQLNVLFIEKSLKQDVENDLVVRFSTTLQDIIPGDAKVLKPVDLVIADNKKLTLKVTHK